MMSTLPDILARSYPSDEIEVYDWDGRYLYTCTLDIPFSSFLVSGGHLYTLTVNLDTKLSEIYRYDLPQEAWHGGHPFLHFAIHLRGPNAL